MSTTLNIRGAAKEVYDAATYARAAANTARDAATAAYVLAREFYFDVCDHDDEVRNANT